MTAKMQLNERREAARTTLTVPTDTTAVAVLCARIDCRLTIDVVARFLHIREFFRIFAARLFVLYSLVRSVSSFCSKFSQLQIFIMSAARKRLNLSFGDFINDSCFDEPFKKAKTEYSNSKQNGEDTKGTECIENCPFNSIMFKQPAFFENHIFQVHPKEYWELVKRS